MKDRLRYGVGVVAMVFLGVTFLTAGTGKLLAGTTAFDSLVFLSFLPRTFIEGLYPWLPYMEILIGSLLIMGIAVRFSTILSAVLITGFIASNIWALYLGYGQEPCGGCFGVFGALTAIDALIIDGIMAILVVILAISFRGDFFNMLPLVFRKEDKRGLEYV